MFPSIPPRLCNLRPNFGCGCSARVSVTLTGFIFGTCLGTISILGVDSARASLIGSIGEVLSRVPSCPIFSSRSFNHVCISIPKRGSRVVCGMPTGLARIFPKRRCNLDTPSDVHRVLLGAYGTRRGRKNGRVIFLGVRGTHLNGLSLRRFGQRIRCTALPGRAMASTILRMKNHCGSVASCFCVNNVKV